MTIDYHEDDATKVVEFHVKGHISREVYEPLVHKLQDFIDRNGTVRMIDAHHALDKLEAFSPVY